jgi:hypothetical protein
VRSSIAVRVDRQAVIVMREIPAQFNHLLSVVEGAKREVGVKEGISTAGCFFAERQRSATPVLGATHASARGVTSIGVGCSAWFGLFFIDAYIHYRVEQCG